MQSSFKRIRKRREISFTVPVFIFMISIWVLVKIYLGSLEEFRVDVDERSYDYGIVDEVVILANDELKYLTWIPHRADTPEAIQDRLSKGMLNSWGILVSGFFLWTDSWQVTLATFSVLSALLFALSSAALLDALNIPKIYLAALLFCPTVLYLGGSILRDLFVLSAMNLLILSLIGRKWVQVSVYTLCLALTRPLYLPLLLPFALHLACRSKLFGRDLSIVLALLIFVLIVFLAPRLLPLVNVTTNLDIAMRLVSSVTGASVAILRMPEALSAGRFGEFFESLGLAYQSMISLSLVTLCVFQTRIRTFTLLVIIFSLTLGYLYGHFLGFFVGRTRLVIAWLALLSIGMQLQYQKQLFSERRDIKRLPL